MILLINDSGKISNSFCSIMMGFIEGGEWTGGLLLRLSDNESIIQSTTILRDSPQIKTSIYQALSAVLVNYAIIMFEGNVDS